ncbi:hypothetical protein DWQ67_02925 [Galactobacter caseinivorans]|uniref:Uncharacterized protein n=1 Tax=Galactobacter caseinivorans TaxID=2676123 RepID=A0A496PMV0_9MICC|nr:hypothetical protein DWQ67_02925 [Galactobacter caseinivorans]
MAAVPMLFPAEFRIVSVPLEFFLAVAFFNLYKKYSCDPFLSRTADTATEGRAAAAATSAFGAMTGAADAGASATH